MESGSPTLFQNKCIRGNWGVGKIYKFTSWYTVEYISILTN